MGTIEITRNVQVGGYDAQDWGLYTDMHGAETIAEQLNVALSIYATHNGNKADCRMKMLRIMEVDAKWGAADSEPQAFLESLLNQIYGV